MMSILSVEKIQSPSCQDKYFDAACIYVVQAARQGYRTSRRLTSQDSSLTRIERRNDSFQSAVQPFCNSACWLGYACLLRSFVFPAQ